MTNREFACEVEMGRQMRSDLNAPVVQVPAAVGCDSSSSAVLASPSVPDRNNAVALYVEKSQCG